MRLVKWTALLAMLSISAFAADGTILKPPAGANLVIVVFEDLECPSCAQAAPLLEKASEFYKIPLVIHDVPSRAHPWAMDAAIIARYIEKNYGRAVSDRYRDYIYANQPQIVKSTLRDWSEKFAGANKVQLPFMLDPQAQLAAAIKADQDLGGQAKITVTPTIFVVAEKSWMEVSDRSQLYSIIEKMKRDLPPPKAAAPAGAKKKRG